MSEQCPDENDLAAYVDDNVSPDERAYIEDHLARCAICRELVVFAFRMDETVTRPFAKTPKT